MRWFLFLFCSSILVFSCKNIPVSGIYTNNTTNAAGCPDTATLNLTISPTVTPIFNVIASICSGSIAPVLSTTSTNGVVGTWSPATISSAVSGAYTYTFTPSMGQCATLATINVVIDPLLIWYADADGDTYGNLAVTQIGAIALKIGVTVGLIVKFKVAVFGQPAAFVVTLL